MSFGSRFKEMGDPAEGEFNTWATARGIGYVEWGLNRPPFSNFSSLPQELRKQPDRLCEDTKRYVRDTYHPDMYLHFLTECKGVGKDQILKIKEQDLDALTKIEDFYQRPVLFFVFDSFHNRVSISHSLTQMKEATKDIPSRMFHDGPTYFPVPVEILTFEYPKGKEEE